MGVKLTTWRCEGGTGGLAQPARALIDANAPVEFCSGAILKWEIADERNSEKALHETAAYLLRIDPQSDRR